jgi:hypothetical protein
VPMARATRGTALRAGQAPSDGPCPSYAGLGDLNRASTRTAGVRGLPSIWSARPGERYGGVRIVLPPVGPLGCRVAGLTIW